MDTENKTRKRKKHADFQDAYRRSSNFNSFVKEDAKKFKLKGNGELKMKNRKSLD